MSTEDLIPWFRARLDADEGDVRESRALLPGDLHWSMPDWLDSTHMLADIAAKQRILDLYDRELRLAEAASDPEDEETAGTRSGAIEEVIKSMALPYAGRAGYREEWRPSDG